MNFVINLYVSRFAEFIAILGARALGANPDENVFFLQFSYKCFVSSRSYLANSRSHSSCPLCHKLSLVGNDGFEGAFNYANGLCSFPARKRHAFSAITETDFSCWTLSERNGQVDNNSSVSVISTIVTSPFSISIFVGRSGY